MYQVPTFNRKHLLHTVRKYGSQPYRIVLLHGGPGASGEMKPVAERLSADFGILELLQTEKSVDRQIEELYQQLTSTVEKPLSERLPDFKMIRLEKCGHTPWKERFAQKEFYEKLRKEL